MDLFFEYLTNVQKSTALSVLNSIRHTFLSHFRCATVVSLCLSRFYLSAFWENHVGGGRLLALFGFDFEIFEIRSDAADIFSPRIKLGKWEFPDCDFFPRRPSLLSKMSKMSCPPVSAFDQSTKNACLLHITRRPTFSRLVSNV